MVKMATSSSPIQFDSNHHWKPGGVLLVLLGRWASAATTSRPDTLGRWTSISIRGQERQVTIFSVYNCVHTRLANAGPSTVFAQQYATLKAAGITHPIPRTQFIHDLRIELQNRQRHHEHIIVLGDLNETVGRDPNMFASLSSEFNLFDPHNFFLGDSAAIPTYSRGSRRIDYCFLSHPLRQSYIACGFNLFHELYHSDHRAHYIDLRLPQFLGQLPPTLAPPSLRAISSRSLSITKFVDITFAHLQHTNAFSHLRVLEDTAASLPHPWLLANKIDTLLQQAFDHACSQCLKPPKPPWSRNLHQASQRVRYWKTHLSGLQTGISNTSTLDSMASTLWPNLSPRRPSSLRITKSALRAAQKRLRSI